MTMKLIFTYRVHLIFMYRTYFVSFCLCIFIHWRLKNYIYRLKKNKREREWPKQISKHCVPLHRGLNEWHLSFLTYPNSKSIVLYYPFILLNCGFFLSFNVATLSLHPVAWWLCFFSFYSIKKPEFVALNWC